MQAAGELQHMQAALTRATADTYHKLDPLGHGPVLRDLQDQRARKREDFSNQFLSLLHQHEMFKHSSTFLAVRPPPPFLPPPPAAPSPSPSGVTPSKVHKALHGKRESRCACAMMKSTLIILGHI